MIKKGLSKLGKNLRKETFGISDDIPDNRTVTIQALGYYISDDSRMATRLFGFAWIIRGGSSSSSS